MRRRLRRAGVCTSPPQPPPKKPLLREDPEGVDPNDFDSEGEAQRVAGFDLSDGPAKKPEAPAAPATPRGPALPLDLPEGEAATPSFSTQRAAPRPSIAPPAPSAPTHRAGPAAPATVSDFAASSIVEASHPAPREMPAPVQPAAAEPANPAAAPVTLEAPPAYRPTPYPAAALPPTRGNAPPAPPQGYVPGFPAGPGYAPYGYAPYPGTVTVMQPYGAPYGAPAGYPPYPPQVFVTPLPPPPPPSPTVEGLYRLQIAAGLGLGYFALAVLHRIYTGVTGLTDVPGGSPGADIGAQFLSFFLTACEVCLAALALSALSSGLLRLRESKGEARLPAPELSKRPLRLLAAALSAPIAVGLLTWLHMGAVQRALPGHGVTTDLGLAALYEEYRLNAVLLSIAVLASAFLAVVGLRAALKHLAPLAPRKAFRQFIALFVVSAAAQAALVLVLLYAVLDAPKRGSGFAPNLQLLAFVVGPLIGCAAFLRLRAYLKVLHSESVRRHGEKPPT